MANAVITHAVRTPIGRIGGSLKDVSDKEMGSLVVRELMRRAGLPPDEIDHLIMGHVRQSADPSNTARVVALMADIPEQCPGVHDSPPMRFRAPGCHGCRPTHPVRGSGGDLWRAGTENMSQAVYFIRNARHGLGTGDHPIEDLLVAGGPGRCRRRSTANCPWGSRRRTWRTNTGSPVRSRTASPSTAR